MAFRLRRGLKSELVNLPLLAQGELIFTTDEGKLYVGTGGPGANAIDVAGTAGGAATLDELTDTNIVDPSPGDVLSWNAGTNKWVAAVPGTLAIGLDDLTDVFMFRSPRADDVLVYDGFNWVPQTIGDFFLEQQNYKINIAGDDSTLIINTDTNDVTGNFFGNLEGDTVGVVTATAGSSLTGNVFGNLTGTVTGDITGSVFADDSTLMIDGISSRIVGPIVNKNIQSSFLELSGTDINGFRAGLRISTDGDLTDGYDLLTINAASNNTEGQGIFLIRSRGTLETPTPLQVGDDLTGIVWFGSDSSSTPIPVATIYPTVSNTPTVGNVPSSLAIALFDNLGVPQVGLSIDKNLVIGVANNTLVAGPSVGDVDNSAAVSYLTINVGGTKYAVPLFAIRI